MRSVAGSSLWSVSSVASNALEVLVEAEVSDHRLEDSVTLDLDVRHLDLGFLWDEVHLSFSLL